MKPTILTEGVNQPAIAEAATLPRLAEQLRVEIHVLYSSAAERALIIGQIAIKAKELCRSPECGVPGRNRDHRFGRWLENENFSPSTIRTVQNFVKLAGLFNQDDIHTIKLIGQSNCYNLGKLDEGIRTDLIDRARDGDDVSEDAKEAIKATRRPPEPLGYDQVVDRFHRLSKMARSRSDAMRALDEVFMSLVNFWDGDIELSPVDGQTDEPEEEPA